MTTDTTDLTELDADALEWAAAQSTARASTARAELNRRAEVRRQALEDRQRAFDGDLVRRWPALEAGLVQQASDQEAAFKRGVFALDLDAALEAWIRGRMTRDARQQIRDAARTAEANAGKQPGVTIPEEILRYYPGNFLDRLAIAAEAAAQALAGATAEHLIGSRPTELDGGAL